MKVKEESEKAGLKLKVQKIKIMASGLITSWQIDGETMETVTDFIIWGSKISADGDGSHEIKRYLLLGRKGMTNLDSVLKNRGITLLSKVHKVTAMIHRCMSIWYLTTQPAVMYICESWTVQSRRLSAEELMLSNCGAGEDSQESLGQQEDQTSQP